MNTKTVIITLLLVAFLCPRAMAVSQRYKIIIEKNPFDPKRGQEQIQEAVGGSIEENALREKYVVYGVVAVGPDKIAYLRELDDKDRKLKKVSPNDLIDGWRVKDIFDQGVLLEKDGKHILLMVFDNKKKERVSNRPVAIATPQVKTVNRPNNIHPARHPTPGLPTKHTNGNKTNQINRNNPFLKAIKEVQKRNERNRRIPSIRNQTVHKRSTPFARPKN